MKINQLITEAVKLPASVEKRTPREHQPAKLNVSQDDPRYDLYKNPFRLYTAGSTLLNSTLHQLYRAQGHPKIGEWQKEQIQLLDDAMYNHPIRKDMTLYHGTIQSPEIIWKKSNTPSNKPIRIHLPAYTSTSTSLKQAEKFARSYKNFKNVLEIYAPAGTPGISLKAFSRYPREDEVLLARGIELEVQPNPQINHYEGIVYWTCRVVGHNPKQYFESSELDEAEIDTPASDEIRTELTKAGYKLLGEGADATVWAKKTGPVIKIIMPSDGHGAGTAGDTFMKFYEFCKEHEDYDNLPKFPGAEAEAFESDDKKYIMINMERLKPIPRHSFQEAMVWILSDLATKRISWDKALEIISDEGTWINFDEGMNPSEVLHRFDSLDDHDRLEYEILFKLMTLLYHRGKINKIGWDMHTENAMMRDGTIVITDPWFNMETKS